MTVFGDGAFRKINEVIRVGPDPTGMAPYKERLGHRQVHAKERHREKAAVYKPKKEASRETKPADTLILDFQPPEL